MYKLIFLKHKNIRPNLLNDIAKLKKTIWKYSITSQKKFIENNSLPNDIHFLIYKKKILIAYTFLNFRLMNLKKKTVKIIVIDNVLIKKKYRGKLGFKLMNIINKTIEKKKKTAFLLCEKKLINFYKYFKWQVVRQKVKTFPNTKKTLLSYNLNSKLKIQNIKFTIN